MSETRKMLMVYMDETDMAGDLPLYEAIVRRLFNLGIAGATVHAGIMGYGKQHHVHRKRLFGVSDDRPVTITAIDTEEKIRAAAEAVRPMLAEGLMALVDVELLEE